MKAVRFFIVTGGMGMVLLVALFGSTVANARYASEPVQPATTPIPTATPSSPEAETQQAQEVRFGDASQGRGYSSRNVRIEPATPRFGQEVTFFVEVINDSNETKTATVEFSVAQLGTGQNYDNVVNVNLIQLAPNSTKTVTANWFPAFVDRTHYCVIVRLIVADEQVDRKQRNFDLQREPIPPGESVQKQFDVCNPLDTTATANVNVIAGENNHPECRASLDPPGVSRLEPDQCVNYTLTIRVPDSTTPGTCTYFVETDISGDGVEFEVPYGPTPTPTNTPVPQPEVPEPPENLDADEGQDRVLLTWEPSPSPNIVGYSMYRRVLGEANFTRITTSLVTELTYRDTTVQGNTVYEYYVTASNEDEESDPSNIVNAAYGQLRLVVQDASVEAGEQVDVLVNIENGDGLCIGAGNIAITYDPTIATFVDVSSTPLTADYAFERSDRSTDNQLYIATIGPQCVDLVGPGSLFVVTFDVSAAAQGTSRLDFITGLTATAIYNRDNLNTPLTVELDNGDLIITDNGAFVLGDLNGDGVVNAADAAIALEIAAGEREPTPEQLRAGDINGDGVINAADAAAILYYAANQEWPDGATARALAAVVSRLAQQSIIVSPDIVTGTVGSTVRVPILLNDTTAVRSATVEVQYPTGLNLQGVELDAALETTDILPDGDYLLRFHEPADGRRVRVSLAGARDLPTGEQPVAWLVFEVAAQAQVGAQLAQEDTNLLPVTVTGVWLSDAAGRDFSTSAIDQPVNGGNGGVQLDGLPGDCNGDGSIDAGDISALVLRIFEGRFADQPGCDVNGDGEVDAGDISALVLRIFNDEDQPNQVTGIPGTLAQAPVGVPSLTLPATLTVGADGTVSLPLTFVSDGTEISSLVFALEIDPDQLRIDPTDADGDGLLDALQASIPAGFEVQTPVLDTETGKIGLLIADLSPPLAGLSDGTLLTLELEAVDTTAETLRGAVSFADDPAVSFGDTSGRSVPGSTIDGPSNLADLTLFLPLIIR